MAFHRISVSWKGPTGPAVWPPAESGIPSYTQPPASAYTPFRCRLLAAFLSYHAAQEQETRSVSAQSATCTRSRRPFREKGMTDTRDG